VVTLNECILPPGNYILIPSTYDPVREITEFCIDFHYDDEYFKISNPLNEYIDMNYIESHMNHGTEYVINDANNEKKVL